MKRSYQECFNEDGKIPSNKNLFLYWSFRIFDFYHQMCCGHLLSFQSATNAWTIIASIPETPSFSFIGLRGGAGHYLDRIEYLERHPEFAFLIVAF